MILNPQHNFLNLSDYQGTLTCEFHNVTPQDNPVSLRLQKFKQEIHLGNRARKQYLLDWKCYFSFYKPLYRGSGWIHQIKHIFFVAFFLSLFRSVIISRISIEAYGVQWWSTGAGFTSFQLVYNGLWYFTQPPELKMPQALKFSWNFFFMCFSC